MSDKTTRAVFKVTIDAPIDKVWSELTRTGATLPFFFFSRCETPGLAPGAPLRMVTPSGRFAGVVGEVLEFDPPNRYSHSFKFTAYDDPPCKVIYELRETGGGTEFTLIADDIPVGTRTEKYMVSGSRYIVANLKSVVERGVPTLGGRFVGLMCRLTESMTPRRSAASEWPLEELGSRLAGSGERHGRREAAAGG